MGPTPTGFADTTQDLVTLVSVAVLDRQFSLDGLAAKPAVTLDQEVDRR